MKTILFHLIVIYILIIISRRGVKDELPSIFSYISSLLKRDMPLVQGLKVYRSGINKRRFRLKKILSKIISSLERGLPLSKSIESFRRLFPKSCVSIIRAGEETGNVPQSIRILNMTLEKKIERKLLFMNSTMFLTITMIYLIVIGCFIASIILPRFLIMFEGFETAGGGLELPVSTRILIGITGFLGACFPYFLILAVILVVLWVIGRKTGMNEQVIAKMPVIGKLSRKRREAYFCYVLSSLLKSGATLERALELTQETIQGRKSKSAISTLINRIRNGERLSGALKETGSFSRDLVWACSIGEERDSLPEVLWWLAESDEAWIRSRTDFLMPIIERSANIIMGLLVGYFVYSIYSPMFLMSKLAGMVGG